MISENKINLITEKIITRLFEDHNGKFYVYHCARDSQNEDDGYKAIMKFGFERYYVNKGAGNMYGPGVYTTTDLESSINNAHKGVYGRVIIKAEVPSLDRFLIWEEWIAKKVYGQNWRMSDQLRLLLPPDLLEEIKHTSGVMSRDGSLFDFLTKPMHWTSHAAHEYWVSSQRKHFTNGNLDDYINGFIFLGGNDGHVAVIKNVKNVIPVEYSKDFCKTWIFGQTDRTLKYTKNDFDTEYLHGKKYDKTFPPSNGWARVIKRGKFNYVNKDGNEISPYWFDAAGDFYEVLNGYPTAEIVYNQVPLILGNDANVYETIDDDYPLCNTSELDEYV